MPSLFWSKQSTRNQQSNLYRSLFLYINILILSPQLYSNPGQWHSLWNSQWHRQCHSWCIDIGIVNSNDIVSPVHDVSFCAQELTYSVSFWTQILTHHASYWIQKLLFILGQFLDPSLNMFGKNLCDKASKIKNLRCTFSSIFYTDRHEIFFVRYI